MTTDKMFQVMKAELVAESSDLPDDQNPRVAIGCLILKAWRDNEHYKRVKEMSENAIFRSFVRGTQAAALLRDKLVELFVNEYGLRRFDHTPGAFNDLIRNKDESKETILDLIYQHSAAPQTYYVAMTAAALLDAGCPEAAATHVLELLDDRSYFHQYYRGLEFRGRKVALHFAVRNGNLRLTQLLLKHPDTDVNIVWNQAGGCPIHVAAQFNHGDMMWMLLCAPGIKVDEPGRRNLPEGDTTSDIRHLGFPHDKISDKTVPATPIRIAAAYGSDKALSSMLTHPAMHRVLNDPSLTGEALCLAKYYQRPACVQLLEKCLWARPDPHAGLRSLMSKHMELSRQGAGGSRSLEEGRQAVDEAARAEKVINSRLQDAMSEESALRLKLQMLEQELVLLREGHRKVQLMKNREELLEKLNKRKEALQRSERSLQRQQAAAAAAAEVAAAEEAAAVDKMAAELLVKEEEDALKDAVLHKAKQHQAKMEKKVSSKKRSKEVNDRAPTVDIDMAPQPGIAEIEVSPHQHQDGGFVTPRSRRQRDVFGSSSTDHAEQQQQSPSTPVAVLAAGPGTFTSSNHHDTSTTLAVEGNDTSSRHQAPPLSLAERLGLKVPIPVIASTPSPS